MLKRYCFILLISCTALPLSAVGLQGGIMNDSTARPSVTHDNVLKLKYGWVWQTDPYLSPLAYSGNLIGLANEWWQPFRSDTRLGRTGKLANWGHVGTIDIHGLRAYSSAYTNLIYGLGFHAGWGAYYRFAWLDNRLRLIIGPFLEADFMVRQIGSNVNKPYSFDVGIDAMAMAGLQWSFYGRKTSYRLRYRIRTNLIGMDYLPDYWQSYFEIVSGVPGLYRCSGHWNHNVVRHDLSLDLQFPHSTWRIAAEHEFLNYATEYMQFTRNQVSIVVGCIWQYRIKPNARL